MRRWNQPKRKPPRHLPAKVYSCLSLPVLFFIFRVRSNPEISFDWINRSLRSERLGQPEITNVSGLHLMSTRMKPHAPFLRLRRADTEISGDHRRRTPDAALWRTFSTTLGEADIVVVRAEVS